MESILFAVFLMLALNLLLAIFILFRVQRLNEWQDALDLSLQQLLGSTATTLRTPTPSPTAVPNLDQCAKVAADYQSLFGRRAWDSSRSAKTAKA